MLSFSAVFALFSVVCLLFHLIKWNPISLSCSLDTSFLASPRLSTKTTLMSYPFLFGSRLDSLASCTDRGFLFCIHCLLTLSVISLMSLGSGVNYSIYLAYLQSLHSKGIDCRKTPPLHVLCLGCSAVPPSEYPVGNSLSPKSYSIFMSANSAPLENKPRTTACKVQQLQLYFLPAKLWEHEASLQSNTILQFS